MPPVTPEFPASPSSIGRHLALIFGAWVGVSFAAVWFSEEVVDARAAYPWFVAGSLAVTCGWIQRHESLSWRQVGLGPLSRSSARLVAAGSASAAASFVAASWVFGYSLELTHSPAAALLLLLSPFGATRVVLVPVWEEVVFRGLLLRALSVKLAPTRAILIQALLFAGWHLPSGDVAQFLAALMLGGLFGAATLTLRRLEFAIAAHMTWNFLTAITG